MDKIKFQTNVPVEVALRFAEGKLCDSQFGDPQYMFSTTDDRAFFVAAKVAQKIHGLRLKPGELIDIVKAEVPYTNGRKGNRVASEPREPVRRRSTQPARGRATGWHVCGVGISASSPAHHTGGRPARSERISARPGRGCTNICSTATYQWQ